MRYVDYAKSFKKDFKRESTGRYRYIIKSELYEVVDVLRKDEPLEFIYQDHLLKGNWQGYRECHLAPNLLLVYRKIGDDWLRLERLGSHSEIFGM